jgi:recombinase
MRSGERPRISKSHSGRWTPEHVRAMLTNPVYGYGIVLEPTEVVSKQVQQLERALAREHNERGKSFSVTELDQRFQALFRQLVEEGLCRREPDAQPLITKEEWLKAQQAAIERLARGEPR